MIRFEDLPIITTNMFGSPCQQIEYYCLFCSNVNNGSCKNCKINPEDLCAVPSKFNRAHVIND